MQWWQKRILIFLCLAIIFRSLGIAVAETYAPDEHIDQESENQGRTAPRPIPRARWSEDWSTFGDPTPLLYPDNSPTDYFWGPIKYIRIGKNKDNYLSLGGEVRLAYEFYDEKDMGLSDIGYQDALQLRTALHGDIHFLKKWRIFGQLGYGTVNDRQGGKKTADEANINIWEFFLGHRFQVNNDERVVLRIGRQLIESANLFINVGEGNNVRQHYDGVRLGWIDEEFIKLDIFAAEYVGFEDGSFSMTGTGEYFWGISSAYRFQKSLANVTFAYFGWDLKDRQFEQSGGHRYDEQRHTLLFRINQPLNLERQLQRPLKKRGRWGYDYYLAYQFGEYEDKPGGSSIISYAAFGELRYAISQRPETTILGLKTAYFSGDEDPEDTNLNTFYNHVFATPFFGYARDIQPFNLIYVQPNIGHSFRDGAILTLGYGFHWRADTNDAFYGKPNGITASAETSDSSRIGQQVQLSVRYLINPNLLLTSYVAHFFADDMIEGAGGEDRDYFHVGIHYLF